MAKIHGVELAQKTAGVKSCFVVSYKHIYLSTASKIVDGTSPLTKGLLFFSTGYV